MKSRPVAVAPGPEAVDGRAISGAERRFRRFRRRNCLGHAIHWDTGDNSFYTSHAKTPCVSSNVETVPPLNQRIMIAGEAACNRESLGND